MTLVEEYYELNEAEEVSGIWKVMQIIFYVSAGCFGVWCGYTVALLRVKFQDKCFLFTSLQSQIKRRERTDVTIVNWENDIWCDFCQYTMVSSFIVATIWATFFLMCGKGGKSLTGLPQPWRIVWPSFFFNLAYFGVTLTAAINIQKGSDIFCGRTEEKKSITGEPFWGECELLYYFLKDASISALQMEIVTKTAWMCAISWLILVFISFFRILFVVDFHMYKVCVFRIADATHNKKEEVLRVTNYEEPKKIHFKETDKKYSFIDLDEDFMNSKLRKKKVEKRSKPQKSPIQPNAAFYVTADIRMLNREKKRKKISKALENSFDLSPSGLRRIHTSSKMHSSLEDVRGFVSPKNLRRYDSEDLYSGDDENDEDDDINSYFEENQKPHTSDPKKKDIFLDGFDTDKSVHFKKC